MQNRNYKLISLKYNELKKIWKNYTIMISRAMQREENLRIEIINVLTLPIVILSQYKIMEGSHFI